MTSLSFFVPQKRGWYDPREGVQRPTVGTSELESAPSRGLEGIQALVAHEARAVASNSPTATLVFQGSRCPLESYLYKLLHT